MVITPYLKREMNPMTRGNFEEGINDFYIVRNIFGTIHIARMTYMDVSSKL